MMEMRVDSDGDDDGDCDGANGDSDSDGDDIVMVMVMMVMVMVIVMTVIVMMMVMMKMRTTMWLYWGTSNWPRAKHRGKELWAAMRTSHCLGARGGENLEFLTCAPSPLLPLLLAFTNNGENNSQKHKHSPYS